MKFNRRVQNLLKQEIISTETAEKIMVTEQIRKTGVAWKLMYFISGLLIGLGAILVVSSHWDLIPDMLKLLGDFAIWGGILYTLYWAFDKKKNNLKECLLLVSFLFVGATIGLIAQIFNMSGSWTSFALTWAILSAVFVILSRLRITNILWLLILFSGLNFDFLWRYIFRYFAEYPVAFLIVGASLCALLSYAGECLYKAINGVIVLPKAFATLSSIAMYCIAVFDAFIIGNNSFRYYFYEDAPFFNWTAIGANTVAFVFLGIRLLLALYKDNIKSFVRNSYIVSIYIIGMFLIRLENSFVKGFIFIIGGLFLLGLLQFLQKSAKRIKVERGL